MKECEVKIEYGHFSCDSSNDSGEDVEEKYRFKKGDRYISADCDIKNAGMGSPCRTKEEAINSLKIYLKNHDIKQEEVEFTNTTEEDIKLGDLYGSNLNQWF